MLPVMVIWDCDIADNANICIRAGCVGGDTCYIADVGVVVCVNVVGDAYATGDVVCYSCRFGVCECRVDSCCYVIVGVFVGFGNYVDTHCVG